ncbi:MAG: hypothetical protein ABS46_06345 [Cytophagaceae bacterium SCN 52-12]|nr:MAG: hypothetical protein ABS46_06345 [Cytophagaceae bacterium SCN 52-12]
MICKLDLTVGCRDGRSYVRDLYAGKPFRAVPVGQYATDNALHMMLMSVSPGILDGDHYDIRISLEEDAQLQLEAQSYQRIYHMNNRATQEMVVSLARGSDFAFIPYPVVPHRNSTFISKTSVALHPEASFLIGEIITCGRRRSGEVFEYAHFQNLVEVYNEQGRLLLKDNVMLVPSMMPLPGIGLLEGYTHQGTLIYLAHAGETVLPLIESLYEQLEPEEDVICGISQTMHPGFVLRMLGGGGEQLYRCFEAAKDLIWNAKKQHL